MKKHRSGCWAGLMIVFGIMAGFWGLSMVMALIQMWDIGAFVVAVVVEALLIWLTVICARKAPRRTDEENAELRAKVKAELREAAEYRAEQKRLDREPVAVKLLYVQSEHGKRAIGTAARGLIGAATLGVFGAAVGIASGRAKEQAKTATFAVKYASGRRGNETVDVRSERFKELSALLLD